MIYGYARCSTDETRQNIDRQIRELKNMGAHRDNIFMEYESGNHINRVELNRLLGMVAEGDAIVATEVSRLTRSMKQLCDLIDFAKEQKLKLVLGSFIVDCTGEVDPMTEGMLKMMGVFSELERNVTRQRVVSGIRNAKAKGKQIGRPKKTPEDVPDTILRGLQLYDDGIISKVECARLCKVSRPTLDKYIHILRG